MLFCWRRARLCRAIGRPSTSSRCSRKAASRTRNRVDGYNVDGYNVDGYNKVFIPGEFYNVGGKTKWYGAALLRFAPHEFLPDEAHQCLGWPIGCDELSPYYDEAEQLLCVNRFDNEPELQSLLDRITAADKPGSRRRCRSASSGRS